MVDEQQEYFSEEASLTISVWWSRLSQSNIYFVMIKPDIHFLVIPSLLVWLHSNLILADFDLANIKAKSSMNLIQIIICDNWIQRGCFLSESLRQMLSTRQNRS